MKVAIEFELKFASLSLAGSAISEKKMLVAVGEFLSMPKDDAKLF